MTQWSVILSESSLKDRVNEDYTDTSSIDLKYYQQQLVITVSPLHNTTKISISVNMKDLRFQIARNLTKSISLMLNVFCALLL